MSDFPSNAASSADRAAAPAESATAAALDAALDQALDLPTGERATWLATLAQREPALAARVQGLLERLAQAEAQDFLARPAAFTWQGAIGSESGGVLQDGMRQAGQRVGPWRLVARLGAGGMAEVWRAARDDGAYVREVALKLPLVGLSDTALERFGRERDLLAALAHPGIARLYEAGIAAQGQPWLALELVDGEPLSAAMADRRGLGLPARVAVLIQACEAVQYAHAHLVLHRDLKPGNMLLDAQGRLRLLDFGIGKLLAGEGSEAAELTRLGPAPMTVAYAAPEQLRGETLGIACDVYALGVVACQLLAGATPFEGAGRTDGLLAAAVLAGASRRPSDIATDPAHRRALRGDLDAIVMKAMAVDPAQRYATAEALGDDLRRHLEGLPVRARPADWRYLAGRFLRRHRLPAAITAVAALALAGATAWALHSAQAERLQAARAGAMYDFVRGLLVHDSTEMSDLAHRDLRVRDLISQAAARLPDALHEAPEARFQLMRDLAPMLDGLGRPDDAIALLQRQHEQASRLFGPDSVEAAKPLIMLAQLAHESRGQLPEAHAKVRRALDTFRARGFEDPEWLGTAEALTGFYGWRARGAMQAEDLAHVQAAVALLRRHPETKSLGNDALSLLSMMHSDRGDFHAAFAAAKEGADFNRRMLGRDNWHTAVLLTQSALAARQLGDLAQAEALQREALDIHRKVWPADHYNIAMAEAHLGGILALGDQQAEVRELLEDALRIMSLPAWSEKAWYRGRVMAALLETLARAGRPGEVEGLRARACVEGVHGIKSAAPNDGPLQLLTAQRCAQAHLRAGDVAGAQAWVEQAGEVAAKHWPGQAQRQAWPRLRSGDLALAQGQLEAAARAYREVLTMAAPTACAVRAEAWLGLSLAAPGTLDRVALARDQAAWAGLPPRYFALLQAQMATALGRVSGARTAPWAPGPSPSPQGTCALP